MEKLEITDFSGGITDNYLDAPLNKYEKADNCLVKNNKKLRTRPGTLIYDADIYQVPAGDVRVSDQFLFEDQNFFQAQDSLYYPTSGTWNTLLGPGSNDAVPRATVSSFISRAEWNKHLIVVSDAFGSPQKVYKNEDGDFQVRNAGLPKVTLTSCISLANTLKSSFNSHIADASEHTTAIDTVNTVTASNATDFGSLVTLVDELMSKYDAHEGDAELGSNWLYHAAQEGSNHSLTSLVSPVTLDEVVTRLNDFKSKFNAHDADGTAHGTDSEYQVSSFSAPQIASAGGTGSNFIYAIHAYYSYYIGDVLFEDFGPTYEMTLTNVGAPNTNTVTISSIPTIANGTTENFATSSIKWRIYRTESGGTTLYYIGEVTNGTSSYADTSASTANSTNSVLYTDGGVRDNDPAPPAKFVTVVNDIAWYGHVKEAGSVKPSRVRQSVKFDPDSCPESFYIDVEDEITGMGYVDIYPIVFCKNHIYRLEGFKDEFGRGTISKREISRTIGSLNHNSIVNTLEGIFFAGNDGWYFTDGSKVVPISDELSTTYSNLTTTTTQQSRIYGHYVVKEDRIYWCVQTSSTSDDCDQMFVCDLYWGIKNQMVFTTITPSTSSWKCASIGTDPDGVVTIGDNLGYLYKFDENSFTDPEVNTDDTPDNWLTKVIIHDYRGPGINFGDSTNRKWPTWITSIFENTSPLSCAIGNKNDDSGYFNLLKEIRFRDHILWGDSEAPEWQPDVGDYKWKVFPMVIEKRRFNARNIRCTYKQIQYTNAFTIVQKSDVLGTVTLDATAKTAVLNNSPTSVWDSDVTDYQISFDNDSYVTNYTVLSRDSASQITYRDDTDTSVSSATRKWVLRGYRKSERINLISYSIVWEPIGPSHATYRGDTGGNA